LAVESDRQFEWGHLQLNLIDDATGASCNDHFTIWNHKSAIEVPSVHRLVSYRCSTQLIVIVIAIPRTTKRQAPRERRWR
jgi:hypothetical protein